MAISDAARNEGPRAPASTRDPYVNPKPPAGMDPNMWALLAPVLAAQQGGASPVPPGGDQLGMPYDGPGGQSYVPRGAGAAGNSTDPMAMYRGSAASSAGSPYQGGAASSASSAAPYISPMPSPTVPPPPPGAPGAGGLSGLMGTGNVQATFGPQKSGWDAIRGAVSSLPTSNGATPGRDAVQARINGMISRTNAGLSGLQGLMPAGTTLPQLPAFSFGTSSGTTTPTTPSATTSDTASSGLSGLSTPNPVWSAFKARNGGSDPGYWSQYKQAVSGGDPAQWQTFKQGVIANNGTPQPGTMALPTPRAVQRLPGQP